MSTRQKFVRPIVKRRFRQIFIKQLMKQPDVEIDKQKANEIADDVMPTLNFDDPVSLQLTIIEQAEKIANKMKNKTSENDSNTSVQTN